jgi:hypothetical protein
VFGGLGRPGGGILTPQRSPDLQRPNRRGLFRKKWDCNEQNASKLDSLSATPIWVVRQLSVIQANNTVFVLKYVYPLIEYGIIFRRVRVVTKNAIFVVSIVRMILRLPLDGFALNLIS